MEPEIPFDAEPVWKATLREHIPFNGRLEKNWASKVCNDKREWRDTPIRMWIHNRTLHFFCVDTGEHKGIPYDGQAVLHVEFEFLDVAAARKSFREMRAAAPVSVRAPEGEKT